MSVTRFTCSSFHMDVSNRCHVATIACSMWPTMHHVATIACIMAHHASCGLLHLSRTATCNCLAALVSEPQQPLP